MEAILCWYDTLALVTLIKGSATTTTQQASPTRLQVSEFRPEVLLHCKNDFFCVTRGRVVCNEAYEMSQPYIRVNINELARLTAEALGSKPGVGIKKHPDGMYHKALLLSMDDGTPKS